MEPVHVLPAEEDRKRLLFEKFLRQAPTPAEELMALEDPIMAGAIDAATMVNDSIVETELRILDHLTAEERKIHFGSLYGLKQGEINGIFAKAKAGAPRFRSGNPPSIVDRIGALEDPGLAKQVERYDRTERAYAKVREDFNKHRAIIYEPPQ